MPENQPPEIDIRTLAEKLRSEETFILLDVRELWELSEAKITDRRLQITPMSRLVNEGTAALSESAKAMDATIYVLCHHGNRSAQVTAWLAQQGWTKVFNVRGGIDQYASQVDDSVGFY
jgi:rhodanese-related sulfurtransferase